jgi:hypothetical protein
VIAPEKYDVVFSSRTRKEKSIFATGWRVWLHVAGSRLPPGPPSRGSLGTAALLCRGAVVSFRAASVHFLVLMVVGFLNLVLWWFAHRRWKQLHVGCEYEQELGGEHWSARGLQCDAMQCSTVQLEGLRSGLSSETGRQDVAMVVGDGEIGKGGRWGSMAPSADTSNRSIDGFGVP